MELGTLAQIPLQICWKVVKGKAERKTAGDASLQLLHDLLVEDMEKLQRAIDALRMKELWAASDHLHSAYVMLSRENFSGAQEYFSLARNNARMAFGVVGDLGWRTLATKISMAAASWCHRDDPLAAKHLCCRFLKALYEFDPAQTHSGSGGKGGEKLVSVASASAEVLSVMRESSVLMKFVQQKVGKLTDARQVFQVLTEVNEWLLFSDPVPDKLMLLPNLDLELPSSGASGKSGGRTEVLSMTPASWYAHHCRFKAALMTSKGGSGAVMSTVLHHQQGVLAVCCSESGDLVSLSLGSIKHWWLSTSAHGPGRELDDRQSESLLKKSIGVSTATQLSFTVPGGKRVFAPIEICSTVVRQSVAFSGDYLFTICEPRFIAQGGEASCKQIVTCWSLGKMELLHWLEVGIAVKTLTLYKNMLYLGTANGGHRTVAIAVDGERVILKQGQDYPPPVDEQRKGDREMGITSQLVVTVSRPVHSQEHTVTFTGLLVTASVDGTMHAFEIGDDGQMKEVIEERKNLTELYGEGCVVTSLAGDSNQSDIFFSGCSTGQIIKWKVECCDDIIQIKPVIVQKVGGDLLYVGELFVHGPRLVSVSRRTRHFELQDAIVKFWSSEDVMCVSELPSLHDVRHVVLSPGGKLITGIGKVIIVW